MRKLEDIVHLALDESALPESAYARAFRLGIRCLRDIHRNYTAVPKAVELSIQSNNTAFLPDDFVSEIRVGYANNKGEIIAFRKNNMLTPNQAECDDRLSQETANVQFSDTIFRWGPFSDGWGMGVSFGSLGIGSDLEYGSYRLLDDKNIIIFDFFNPISFPVILEYIPVLGCEDEYPVHEAFEEAVISYIKWKFYDTNRTYSRGDKNEWKQDYYKALKRGRAEVRNINLHDVYSQWRRATRSAPKA